jgi:DNA-binding CsgD family transcriptional regulator
MADRLSALYGTPLTAREVQVLASTVSSSTYASIGGQLNPPLTTATVRAHLGRIRAKLGARNTCQAIYNAYTDGWLPRPDREPRPRLPVDERHLMQLLVQGKTSTQVAAETGQSEVALKYRLKILYRRLGAKSRNQAIHRAVAFGDLTLPQHRPAPAAPGAHSGARP